MKKDKDREEEFFKTILSKSELKLPFTGFEDEVMMAIREKHLRKKIYSTDVTLSWIFFITGALFGLAVAIMIPQLEISVFGINSGVVGMVFQLCFTVFVLLHLDLLMRFTRNAKNKAFEKSEERLVGP